MLITYLWNNWKYSDAPEGQRPFEKLVGLTKYGFAASTVTGIYDSIFISQTRTLWTTVNCLSYWVVPATTMCAAFASVAYTTTKIRGKDGYLNYFLASLAAGAICYQWRKDGPFTFFFTFILTGLAITKKYGDLNNWTPIPIRNLGPDKRQYTTFPYDFTLYKDPKPKTWE